MAGELQAGQPLARGRSVWLLRRGRGPVVGAAGRSCVNLPATHAGRVVADDPGPVRAPGCARRRRLRPPAWAGRTKQAFRVRDRVVTNRGACRGTHNAFCGPKTWAHSRPPSTVSVHCPGPTPVRRATPSGWVPSTVKGGQSASSRACIGSSVRAWCCVVQGPGRTALPGFALDPTALNTLEPGRKPLRALNPALAVFDDGRVMPYGTMGGEGQPQTRPRVFHALRALRPVPLDGRWRRVSVLSA